MGKQLARVIGWATKILGTILDLRELWNISKISGGGGVVAVIIAIIQKYPIWAIITIPLVVLLLTALLLILIKKKTSSNNLKAIPRILYDMNERARALALGKGAKMVDRNEEGANQVNKDLADIMGIGDKQLENYRDGNKKLGKRKEKAILDKTAKSRLFESMDGMSKIATLMEQHGIGLKQLCDKDFRYNFCKEQLNTLRPMPTELINNEVDSFLECSYVTNSFLMIQNPFLGTIKNMWSSKVSIANWQLLNRFKKEMNRNLAKIKEHIEK